MCGVLVIVWCFGNCGMFLAICVLVFTVFFVLFRLCIFIIMFLSVLV